MTAGYIPRYAILFPCQGCDAVNRTTDKSRNVKRLIFVELISLTFGITLNYRLNVHTFLSSAFFCGYLCHGNDFYKTAYILPLERICTFLEI